MLSSTVQDVVKQETATMRQQIKDRLERERTPYTANERYLSKQESKTFAKLMKARGGGDVDVTLESRGVILAELAKSGLQGVHGEDLMLLLRKDEFEAELKEMAYCTGYWHVRLLGTRLLLSSP